MHDDDPTTERRRIIGIVMGLTVFVLAILAGGSSSPT